MRDTKLTIPSYNFYDRTGIQNYLEKQAANGWMLEKIGSLFWHFRRVEPKPVRFCVTYFPGAHALDPSPSEEERNFQELCTNGGWTLAQSNAQMQIFYSESENPMPIETDPVIEVENIHKTAKKDTLVFRWVLIAIYAAFLLYSGINIYLHPVYHLASSMSCCSVVGLLLLFLGTVFRLSKYYRWHRKARRAAHRDGIFVETRSNIWLESLDYFLVLVGDMAIILFHDNRNVVEPLIFSVAMAVVLALITWLITSRMKRAGVAGAVNIKYTLIVMVVVFLLEAGLGVPAFTDDMIDRHRNDQSGVEELPLDMKDLLGQRAGEYMTVTQFNDTTPFLDLLMIYQHHENSKDAPHMEYRLVRVKHDALYYTCLEEFVTIPASVEDGYFTLIDPVPWGADMALQLRDEDNSYLIYVLCYDDCILRINTNWKLTEEQMVTVAGIFE